MSKAEEFIREHTRNCSNTFTKDLDGPKPKIDCYPWLTPDQARKAVELEREETIEKSCDAYCKVCGHYAHKVPTYICRHNCNYYDDFKEHLGKALEKGGDNA